MRIGVPKEIKNHEYRVGLTPASVKDFAARLAGSGIAAGAIASRFIGNLCGFATYLDQF